MLVLPERYRIKEGQFASVAGEHEGAFLVPHKSEPMTFRVYAMSPPGWEHVSVSLPRRMPSWDEMLFIKALFFEKEDVVVSYVGPGVAHEVNFPPQCWHLWRMSEGAFPVPLRSFKVNPKECEE